MFRFFSRVFFFWAFIAIVPELSAQTPKAHNPVIYADVPDISMIRVGDTFYSVSTTMHLCPGIPVMKSKDLVNWEIVNYAYDTLGDMDELSLVNGKSNYGRGSWASSLRYYKGKFYIATYAQTTNKTYIFSTTDIEKGKWQKNEFQPGFHDCSLVFDNDNAYLITGSGRLQIIELNSDLSGVEQGGVNQVLIENAGAPTEPNLLKAEGSHLFMLKGKYYLFNISWPRGGMRTVLVHRADHLFGPWEGRIALQDKGVAQGSIIDTPDGRWFAYLFQDHGAVGRIPYLVPLKWVDGWPVLGVDAKVPDMLDLPPNKSLIPGVVNSDDFQRKKGELPLPLVWQWNHNPDNRLWSVTERPGYLRLRSARIDTLFLKSRNTLTQRTFGPVCSGIILLDASGLKNGDFAGLVSFQRKFGQVGVKVSNNCRYVYMVSNKTDQPVELESIPLHQNKIYLKIECDFRNQADIARFFYSTDAKKWKLIGGPLRMEYTLMEHFMGYRFGLYYYSSKNPGGCADFDFFHISDQISENN